MFGIFERCPSNAAKKNARSLLIGPPSVPPNWLICDLGRLTPRAVRMGVFEFNDSSRKYSNALPCHWFVPDLVTTLITAPPARPNSAEKPFWFTWNSCTDSSENWYGGRGPGRPNNWPKKVLLLSAPSTCKLLKAPFCPPTAKSPWRGGPPPHPRPTGANYQNL